MSYPKSKSHGLIGHPPLWNYHTSFYQLSQNRVRSRILFFKKVHLYKARSQEDMGESPPPLFEIKNTLNLLKVIVFVIKVLLSTTVIGEPVWWWVVDLKRLYMYYLLYILMEHPLTVFSWSYLKASEFKWPHQSLESF